MKKTIVLLSTLVLLCGQVFALVSFHTDAEIREGDSYTLVYAFEDAIIDVTGGNVATALVAFGKNTINVTGGYLSGLGTNSGSDAIFNIYTGANIGSLSIGESGKGYISGGTIGTINISSPGSADLTGGNITNYLMVSSVANIYVRSFNYNPLAGTYDGGQLTGFWLDGTAFLINLKNYGGGDNPVGITYDNLNLIPEPASMVLLGLGGLLLRRRK